MKPEVEPKKGGEWLAVKKIYMHTLTKSIGKFYEKNDGVVLLCFGNNNTSKRWASWFILQKGPKFGVEPRLKTPELLAMARKVGPALRLSASFKFVFVIALFMNRQHAAK